MSSPAEQQYVPLSPRGDYGTDDLASMSSEHLGETTHMICVEETFGFFSSQTQKHITSQQCVLYNEKLILLNSLSPAVILPTIWRYLQTLDAPPYFLGLALSAFSLSGLLSGPLFGHWSDRTQATKKIILFANLFEIIGEVKDTNCI